MHDRKTHCLDEMEKSGLSKSCGEEKSKGNSTAKGPTRQSRNQSETVMAGVSLAGKKHGDEKSS
jgi:hypothetical protein